MSSEDDGCREAERVRRIDDAFRRGDLDALRAAVDDPSIIPNGPLPVAIGACLTYAIYHSPLPLIRTLLELGADPDGPAADGFPPLFAALSGTREHPGAPARVDVVEIVRLLLARGADPNVRGVNDYTPLHMAVAERNTLALQVLLDGGADPDLRTRIDECETAGEMATAAGLTDMAAMLARRGLPEPRRLRPGLLQRVDVPGSGDPVRRQHTYAIRLRLWLKSGDPVRWKDAWGPVGVARLEDEGATLVTEVRIDRRSLVNGLFYGVEGMRVGGMRRLEIAPHLAYGDRGVPGIVPPGASLTAEITIVAARAWPPGRDSV